MRDYKNVTVPKQYRTRVQKTTIKRVETTRIARRSTAVGKVKNGALHALVLVVIAIGGWLGWEAYRIMMHAEAFQIAGVDVKGVQHLTEDDLKKIVGAFTGENIFRVDLEAAVARAVANPWIQSVSIHRTLPNRISMTVSERTPFAVLVTGTGKFLLDSEGVVISRLGKETASAVGLPNVISKYLRVRPGEQAASEGITEAMGLLSELAARGGWPLEEVTLKAAAPESLTIVYAQHEFRIGRANYPEKLRRLAEIMEDVKRRNLTIAYVDLRPERQAAVMVKNAGSKGSNAK